MDDGESSNDLKIVLLFIFQCNSINNSYFMKITKSIKIILNCGSCSDNMIDLSEELLNDRIYSDYKQILILLQSERPALARQLALEVITYKLH
jgi:hypothetical protein